MPCDTRRRPGQSLDQRKAEVRTSVSRLATLLATAAVKPVISKATGAIAFSGWSEADRANITDACAYRLLMATGSATAKAAIARAEALAGRTVNRQALAQGVHSHDGGHSWHHGH